MPEVVVGGAIIEFTPDPSWSWAEWDGRLALDAAARVWSVDGRMVAIAEDVERMHTRLSGRPYVAKGFADVPGAIAEAAVQVERGTLSRHSRLGGEPVVLITTTGSFRVTVGDPSKAHTSADPTAMHAGAWKFIESANHRFKSS
jgi:hypothetical protein